MLEPCSNHLKNINLVSISYKQTSTKQEQLENSENYHEPAMNQAKIDANQNEPQTLKSHTETINQNTSFYQKNN
jgi:outer membrane murein-binding lipoprotein Lpp